MISKILTHPCSGIRAFPNVVAYNMSKAALDQLTRTCALEVGKYNYTIKKISLNNFFSIFI